MKSLRNVEHYNLRYEENWEDAVAVISFISVTSG